VEPAPFGDRGSDQRLDIGRARNVGLAELGFTTRLTHNRDSLLATPRGNVGDHYFRTLAGENQRRRSPDTAASASDHSDLALQQSRHCLFSPPAAWGRLGAGGQRDFSLRRTWYPESLAKPKKVKLLLIAILAGMIAGRFQILQFGEASLLLSKVVAG